MPCYIDQIRPPSRKEYDQWVQLGYLGTWDDYCHGKKGEVGSKIFICGDLGPHCSDCSGFGDFLCDYPVGNGLTCDRAICVDHANEIGPDLHYCATHYKMWLDFKRRGGVDDALKNVIAFKSEK